jgi:AcrR family transcriptional regulator
MSEVSSIDRRIVRTKVAIREALVSLIAEKGFDALSVKDITLRADINRGTFYLHYRDKFDLLDQTETEIVRDVENIVLQANSLNFADFNSTDNPLPIVVAMFTYMKENAALMHAVLGLEGDFAFLTRLRQTVEKNLKLGFLAGLKAQNFLVPSEYLITYILSAHFGVIQIWLQNGCLESPHEMAIILSKLSLQGAIRMTGFVMPA